MNINLKNYKLFSGCYIIIAKNGIEKEYFIHNNQLKFEGGYLNGKRNGRGKEFTDGDVLIFEGSYLNGKRNGWGQEYNDDDLIFEGEYKNNKKWNGKGYDITNFDDPLEILYENSKNKRRQIYELENGEGIYKKHSITSNIIFEGEYINGDLNGKCKEYYNPYNTISFEGEYLNGKKWNGKGYDINGNIIYELINGKGQVKQYNSEGNDLKLEFEGEYINGEKNGNGKEYNYDGKLMFEGEYKDGKKNGKGKYFNNKTDELQFEGEFLYDMKIKGKEYIKGKLSFEGEYYFNEKYDGKGYDKNGNILYILNNGNGKVKYYNFNGNLSFEGEYKDGKINGEGKDFIDNKLIFEG